MFAVLPFSLTAFSTVLMPPLCSCAIFSNLIIEIFCLQLGRCSPISGLICLLNFQLFKQLSLRSSAALRNGLGCY